MLSEDETFVQQILDVDVPAKVTVYEKHSDFVDTRGQWPVYIDGYRAVVLRDQPHSISLADARRLANG